MTTPKFSYPTLVSLWDRWVKFKSHPHYERSTTKSFGMFVALIYPFTDIPDDILIAADEVAYEGILKRLVGQAHS